MPNSQYEIDLFVDVLCSVLEDMAFIFTDDLSEEEFLADPGPCLAAEMEFYGPHQGEVTLAAQFPLCVELAVNILGADRDEVSEPVAVEAMKEVLNLACGEFLTARYGPKPVFDLTVPKVKKIDSSDWSSLAELTESRALTAEEWQLVVNINMEKD